MAPVDARDWILVCGGFHEEGAMDRANAALARYLVTLGARVHLVTHHVAPDLAALPGVGTTLVAKPGGSYMAGELLLERAAHRLASRRGPSGSRPVLLANGGNAGGADINWVHSVHHAWPVADAAAPWSFRVKNRATKAWARLRERRALGSARAIVSNSARTREDLVACLGVPRERVRTIHLGTDPSWIPPAAAGRAEARTRWCADPGRPLVLFCGAIGQDRNKGIDTLLEAWQRLPAEWDAELVVAGGGAVEFWRTAAAGVSPRIRVIGHSASMRDLLTAADLLVSPSRYEAYGLAVHEALCLGVPVVVSASAGIVERFTPEARPFLLDRPGDPQALADRLQEWRRDPAAWTRAFAGVGAVLRAHTWTDMAVSIVDLAFTLAVPAGQRLAVGTS